MIELYQLPNYANGTVEATPKQDEDASLVEPIIPSDPSVGAEAAAGSSFTREAFLHDLSKIKRQPVQKPSEG